MGWFGEVVQGGDDAVEFGTVFHHSPDIQNYIIEREAARSDMRGMHSLGIRTRREEIRLVLIGCGSYDVAGVIANILYLAISGSSKSSKPLEAFELYSRYTVPSLTLPVRPALCVAVAFDIHRSLRVDR